MTKSTASLTKYAAWQALEAHYPQVRELHLRKLFADDPNRGERMKTEAVEIYFDYSKHRNVINIGIGGSCLGPEMAYEELRHYSRRELTFRLVSNIDGTDFTEATRDLDAEETLFIIIPELEIGVTRQLRHDSSTNNLIRSYRRSQELLHGR